MADVTETHHGSEELAAQQRIIGLVAIFSESGQGLAKPHPVTRPVRIGRDAGAGLRLDDKEVSREHAEVGPVVNGITVTDLGSHNGTFVDGQRVREAMTPAPVGACVRCGTTLLTVVGDVELFRRNPPCIEPPLVGSARMAEIRRLVATVAPLGDAVLLLGATGTGKERVAEALHVSSGRRGAFVPVNCSAIPQNLVESELFGHARGAFSGSQGARAGLFRTADGGTLFLDEIADLPANAQAKLLRALETGEVRSVGEDRLSTVDVRVIAATNADLGAMVRDGRFRADLMHRISTWKIELPPLERRLEDVPLLAEHFLPPETTLSIEAMERLMLWGWPGNVRELRSVVTTAATRAASGGSRQILLAHLPPEIAANTARGSSVHAEPAEDAMFRARAETALRLRKGNMAQVARDLGCGRPWLYQELKRLNVDISAFRKR
jgi:DNA-binding NtrC family response regulator